MSSDRVELDVDAPKSEKDRAVEDVDLLACLCFETLRGQHLKVSTQKRQSIRLD